MTKSQSKKILIRSTILIFSFLLSFALVEGATRLFLVRDRLNLRPENAFHFNQNAFNHALLSNYYSNCSWLEAYRPSINFGYVYENEGPCALPYADVNGFQNMIPFPESKDKKKFSVLILGGSVAEALAMSSAGATSVLQREFDLRYRGPHGEPIAVYSGAIGGWAVPTQEMVLMTYMQNFDAIISIDGANELTRLRNPNNVGQLDSMPLVFRFDHTWLFGIEFALVKKMRTLRKIWPFTESYALAGLLSLLEAEAQKELYDRPNREGSISRTANLRVIPGQPNEDIIENNIQRYIRHAKNIHAMSRANGLLSLHIIQPITGIAKPLTEEEKPFEEYINRDLFRELERKTLTELKGQPTYSQVEIFANVHETIYADRVHPKFDGKGYGMMASDIVTKAAANWKLRPVR